MLNTDPTLKKMLCQAVADGSTLPDLLVHFERDLIEFIKWKIGSFVRLTITEEDVRQETYIVAFRQIKSLQTDEPCVFLVWLKAIATHQILDEARRQNAKKRGGGNQEINLAGNFESSAILLIEELAGKVTIETDVFIVWPEL